MSMIKYVLLVACFIVNTNSYGQNANPNPNSSPNADAAIFRGLFPTIVEEEGGQVAEKAKPKKSTKSVASKSVPTMSGLNIRLEKLMKDGTYLTVNPSSVFQSGDEIRIKIMSSSNGYVKVINKDQNGEIVNLLPGGQKHGSVIKAQRWLTLPNKGAFKFDDEPGDQIVTISFYTVAQMNKVQKTTTASIGSSDDQQPIVRGILLSSDENQKNENDTGLPKGIYGAASNADLKDGAHLQVSVKLKHM